MSNILFLTLKVFSATGGIEKVCRVAGKALFELGLINGTRAKVFCMYDQQQDANDNKYFPSEMFKGFGTKKIQFIFSSILQAKKNDTIILSHINLILVGWLIKKIKPSTKLILIAHGIEVWNLPNNSRKRRMMKSCDQIISVSDYTSKKVQELHGIPSSRCSVLNNCLDPFLPLPRNIKNSNLLRSRYGYKESDKILFTLTRLSSKERYKGYDKVLESMVELKSRYPEMHYLIAGSYDVSEKNHIEKMIAEFGLQEKVTIAGFIPDAELVEHFSMSDLYVMPSMKEGFGIVFIEAMYYNLPVIAGNKDGSVDALCNGKLGILVDPQNTVALTEAIEKIIVDKKAFIPDRSLLLEHFGYDVYKRNLYFRLDKHLIYN